MDLDGGRSSRFWNFVVLQRDTRHYNPESSNLDIHSRESMEYHVLDFANKTFN
jgi:hypothetical protein